MATSKESSQPNTYFIMGHGTEQPVKYTRRAKVPKGMTLVIPTNPYETITTENVRKLLQLNREKPYLFKNPKKYRKAIEKTLPDVYRSLDKNATLQLRFYDEGDLIPDINIILFNVFEKNNIVMYTKSGVYENTVPAMKYKKRKQNVMKRKITNFRKHLNHNQV